MSSLRALYASDGNQPGLGENMNVDFVINYKIAPAAQAEAEAGFTELIQALTKAGLASEVRPGVDNSSVLVFVKIASEKYLKSKLYRERVQDWLYGVRIKAPHNNVDKVFEEEPISDAERLRLVYLLLTNPKNSGGAGITPKSGHWKNVESIFPLHNHAFNSHWIKQWSQKYILKEEDIEQIREKFGEEIAFYFAFLQTYFTYLTLPAAFGLGVWAVVGKFSYIYAMANSLWTLVFFEYWKKKEVDLAVQWGVRGVSKIQRPRSKFQWEREVADPITGEPVKFYPPMKRLQTQLLQFPFVLLCVLILGSLFLFCFSIEIFLTEMYHGPFKSYLTFTPTVILITVLPALSTILSDFAGRLTEMENYETHDAHDAALTQKIFVVNFITSYLPLFLTSYLYMPFGKFLVPYLDIFRITAQKLSANEKIASSQGFTINHDRLPGQIVYFTVTAQAVNFLTETIVPYVKQRVFAKVKEAQGKGAAVSTDHPEEAKFLARVRKEAQLELYDVAGDYREMVVQFGYLSLFSCVWSLASVSFLINNWVELRGDAIKIAASSQRPIPWRAESIGPWLNALGFLSWFGCLNSVAVVYLFGRAGGGPSGTPTGIVAWVLLLNILFAEHVYLAVQIAVRYVLSQTDSPGLQKERAERFAMRKQLLEETLGKDLTEKPEVPNVATGEKITREALEDEARRASASGGSSPSQAFWLRQQGMDETITIGRQLISSMATQKK